MIEKMECKNTVPEIDRKNDNKNVNSFYSCPEDFKKCFFFNSEVPEESRCQTDSTTGYCVIEYFNDYDSSEVIKEDGDTKRQY